MILSFPLFLARSFAVVAKEARSSCGWSMKLRYHACLRLFIFATSGVFSFPDDGGMVACSKERRRRRRFNCKESRAEDVREDNYRLRHDVLWVTCYLMLKSVLLEK